MKKEIEKLLREIADKYKIPFNELKMIEGMQYLRRLNIPEIWKKTEVEEDSFLNWPEVNQPPQKEEDWPPPIPLHPLEYLEPSILALLKKDKEEEFK